MKYHVSTLLLLIGLRDSLMCVSATSVGNIKLRQPMPRMSYVCSYLEIMRHKRTWVQCRERERETTTSHKRHGLDQNP